MINELKTKIIDSLNLDGVTPGDIDENAPLFGDEGLGLDSIDVLELIVLLERDYGIRLSNPVHCLYRRGSRLQGSSAACTPCC